jgi:hypothetical protein
MVHRLIVREGPGRRDREIHLKHHANVGGAPESVHFVTKAAHRLIVGRGSGKEVSMKTYPLSSRNHPSPS